MDEDTWRLALEDWAIWERWEVAFHAKQTGLDTHPALPEDGPQHEVLAPLLKARLKTAKGGVTRPWTVPPPRAPRGAA